MIEREREVHNLYDDDCHLILLVLSQFGLLDGAEELVEEEPIRRGRQKVVMRDEMSVFGIVGRRNGCGCGDQIQPARIQAHPAVAQDGTGQIPYGPVAVRYHSADNVQLK